MTENWCEQYLKEGDCAIGLGSYQVSNSESVTVLIVGRTQTGKTTIINTLINPRSSSSHSSYSETREPQLHKLIVTKTAQADHKSYQLNIIDTPGLKEVRRTGEKAYTDKELLDLSTLFVKENIARINMVAMITRAGETNREDIEVFREIIRFLGDEFSKISMLILTHCDGFKNNKISEFEKEIMSHDKTKEVFDYCKLGLWRVGALDRDNVESYENDELARNVILNRLNKNVEFRESFLNKIFELAGKDIHVSSLQTMQDDMNARMEAARMEGYYQAKNEKNGGCEIQ